MARLAQYSLRGKEHNSSLPMVPFIAPPLHDTPVDIERLLFGHEKRKIVREYELLSSPIGFYSYSGTAPYKTFGEEIVARYAQFIANPQVKNNYREWVDAACKAKKAEVDALALQIQTLFKATFGKKVGQYSSHDEVLALAVRWVIVENPRAFQLSLDPPIGGIIAQVPARSGPAAAPLRAAPLQGFGPDHKS